MVRTLAALLACVLAPPAAAAAENFQFLRLNRTYEAFIADLVPIDLGSVHVDLRTPDHALQLVQHNASLEPLGGGEHVLNLEFRLSGYGKIDADVTFGRVSSRLSDELTVPLQTLRLFSRVKVLPAEDGYAITATVIQPELLVQIESKLTSRLFTLCRPMALVLVGLDCEALETALTRVRVPMPAPGETYVLPYAEIDAAERLRFDGYLARHRG